MLAGVIYDPIIKNVIFVSERDLQIMNDDKRYAYITYHDLRNSLSYKQTTMVIKAPPESKLEVPDVISNKEEKQVKIWFTQ